MNGDPKRYIVRSYGAGVFHGEIAERSGKEVLMRNARRIWYWAGAASLSELAMSGPGNPKQCKFPIAVPEVTLTDVIEILPTTDDADKAIDAVAVWSEKK